MTNDFIPSIKVTFYITADEFDLDEVTHRLRITPTKTRTKDSFSPQVSAYTVWALEIKEGNCIAVSIVFEKLLTILQDKEEIINRICSDYSTKTGFEVVIHAQDGDLPEIVLPREVVSFAAAINAEIGFDLYCYE